MDVAYYVVLVTYARGDEGYEEGNIIMPLICVLKVTLDLINH